MAESEELLKRMSMVGGIVSKVSKDDKDEESTSVKINLPVLDTGGKALPSSDRFDVIRKRFSNSQIEVARNTADEPIFPRNFSRTSRIKPSMDGVVGVDRSGTTLLQRHLRESFTTPSPRPKFGTEGAAKNKELFEKYLGTTNDRDFLKIPDRMLKGAISPGPRGRSSKNKQRVLSSKKGKETVVLTEEDVHIFCGNTDNIPPEPSNVVRVFISSTFSDFKEERNTIIKRAYPVLKSFASWLGLEFHLVDMRWGVTDEATNDHLTEKLCLTEIEKCNKVSFGPSFVCLLGNRYGYRPIPHEIDSREFETLVTIGEELQLDHNALFWKWYRQDKNAVPPVYIMQPISTYFPYFQDNREEVRSEQEEDARLWKLELTRLQQLFLVTGKAAYERGTLSDDSFGRLKMSVTEMEISKALEDRKDDIICMKRDLTGLEEDLQNPTAIKFTDLYKTGTGEQTVDRDAEESRTSLSEKLATVLKPDNIFSYSVKWYEDGINQTAHPEHYKYLRIFCRDFVKRLQALLQQRHDAVMLSSNLELVQNVKKLKDEILHHAHFCVSKCQIFYGREIEMRLVKQLFESPNRKPVIVSADSGSGKTAFMAMVAKTSPEWLGQSCVRVIRFLGTSPDTSILHGTLIGICRQICIAYDQKVDESLLMETASLVRYFQDLLSLVSRYHCHHRPLLLALDSIDQLSSSDGAHSLQWLPRESPPGVYIIISFIPGIHGLHRSARELFSDEGCFVKLHPLTVQSCQTIVEMYLHAENRTLDTEQVNLLRTYFSENSPLPLLLKMVTDEACSWRSYTNVSDIELPLRAEDAIESLFIKTERKYGTKTVAYTFGYITVSLNGLSETELKDTLSCNDEVVNEIFQYHDPPVPGMVRVPQLFWARIKNEIKDYIVERQSDGKTTYCWYHRQFIEAAKRRYVSAEMLPRLHADLAAIFLAESGIQKTVRLYKRNKLIQNADRQVTPQPLNEKNRRKLRALSYHLLYSTDIESLKQNAMCNFYYLVCRIKAFSVGELLLEFSRVLSVTKDATLHAVCECIRQGHSVIDTDILQLGVQLLGRIQHLSESDPLIADMCGEAKRWFHDQQRCVLAPVFSCLPARDGNEPLWQLEGPTGLLGFSGKGIFTLGLCPSDFSHSTQLQVINLRDKKTAFTIHQFDGFFKAAEILELSRHQVKIMVLTDKSLTVTVYSAGGDVLETRRLATDFSGHDHHTGFSTFGYHEQFRFGRYLLRLVLAGEWTLFDVPERQYLNDEIDIKHPDIIHFSNYHRMDTKYKISAIKVLNPGYILTCHGVTGQSEQEKHNRGTLILWEDGKRIFQVLLPSPVSTNKMIAHCPQDGNTVLVGCQCNEVIVVTKSHSKWRATMLKPDTQVGKANVIAYHSFCRLVVTFSDKRGVYVYNIQQETSLFSTRLQNVKAVRCASLIQSGHHVLTGHKDGEMIVWKIDKTKRTFTPVNNIRSHTESITEIYNQRETYTIVMSEDRNMKVFDQRSLTETSAEEADDGALSYDLTSDSVLTDELCVNDCLVRQNDLHIVTSSENRAPMIWRMSNGKYLRSMSGRKSEAGTIKILFGHQEKLVVGQGSNHCLRLWNYDSGETVKCPQLSNIIGIKVTSDSSKAVVVQFGNKCMVVSVVDLEQQALIRSFPVDQGARLQVDRMILTQDNRYLVLSVRTKGMEQISSRILKAVDLEKPGDPIIPCRKRQGATYGGSKTIIEIPTYFVEILGGSKVLVGKNGKAFCWEIGEDKSRRSVKGHMSLYHSYVVHSEQRSSGTITSPVVYLKKSEDGRFIATADSEGYVVLWQHLEKNAWDVKEGDYRILHKHGDMVTAMTFSDKGDLLITASLDLTLRIWDTTSGALKHTVQVGMEVIKLCICSEKGYLVALAKRRNQSRVMAFRMLCTE